MNIHYRPAGYPTDAAQFFKSAYKECPEFHHMDYLAAKEHFVLEVEKQERLEVIEPTVGGMIIVVEDDLHVSDCVTAWFTYIEPEYRNSGIYRRLFRELLSVCNKTGIKNYAYSHRVGTGKYFTTYGRIKNGQSS